MTIPSLVSGDLVRCELVDRLRIADALRDQVLIRGDDGTEIRLRGLWIDAHGFSMSDAEVDAVGGVSLPHGRAQARFRRDAEAAVGEPFALLLFFPDVEERVVIALKEVAELAVCSLVRSSEA